MWVLVRTTRCSLGSSTETSSTSLSLSQYRGNCVNTNVTFFDRNVPRQEESASLTSFSDVFGGKREWRECPNS